MASNEQKEEEGDYATNYDSYLQLSSLLHSFELNNNNNNDNNNNNNNNDENNIGEENNNESFNINDLNINALDGLDGYVDYNHFNYTASNDNNDNNNDNNFSSAFDLSNALDQLNSFTDNYSDNNIDNNNNNIEGSGGGELGALSDLLSSYHISDNNNNDNNVNNSDDNNNSNNNDNNEDNENNSSNDSIDEIKNKEKEEERRRREEEEEYERMMFVIKQQKKKTYSTRAISKKFRISKLSPPPPSHNNDNDNNEINSNNNDNNNYNDSNNNKKSNIKKRNGKGVPGIEVGQKKEILFDSLNSPKPLFDLTSDLPSDLPSTPHPLVHFSDPSPSRDNNNDKGEISDHLSDLLSSLNSSDYNTDNNNNDNNNNGNGSDDFDLTAALDRLNQYNNDNNNDNDNNTSNSSNRDAIAELNDSLHSLHSLSYSAPLLFNLPNDNDDDENDCGGQSNDCNDNEGGFDISALENININNLHTAYDSSPSSSSSSPSYDLSALTSHPVTNENLNTNHNNNNNKKEEKEKEKGMISYDEFFKGLKGGLGGGEESNGGGEAAQQRYEDASRDRADRLLRSFAVKEDMNKRGMKRTSKKSYTLDLHGRTIGVYQMEDANYVGHPIFGSSDFGLFAVFDGHVGRSAAEFASLHLSSVVEEKIKKYGVNKTMGKVLNESFYSLDEKMKKFELEGTTATVVLVWKVGPDRFLRSANVGDSSSFLSREDKAIMISKDHKINDPAERERLIASGTELFPNQNRLNGLAVSRALGDHMIKSNFPGVTWEPHLSDVFQLRDSDDKLIIASDGLWDIVSGQTAVNMIKDMKEASSMASSLVSKAVSSPKCNDNVTVIVVLL